MSRAGMIVLGVLGLPASGKSAVAEILQSHGARWINADRIGHQVLQGVDVKERLTRRWGGTILRDDGEIDRPRLGEIVFGDDAASQAALEYLESIVHPLIREQMTRQVAAALREDAPAVVLDAPLLLESQWDVWCDEIWYVETSEAIRAAAAARRGWSIETLQRRTARQLHGDAKRRLSTRLIPNHGTLEQLRLQIASLWRQLVDPERSLLGPEQRSGVSSHCRDRLLADELP